MLELDLSDGGHLLSTLLVACGCLWQTESYSYEIIEDESCYNLQLIEEYHQLMHSSGDILSEDLNGTLRALMHIILCEYGPLTPRQPCPSLEFQSPFRLSYRGHQISTGAFLSRHKLHFSEARSGLSREGDRMFESFIKEVPQYMTLFLAADSLK